MVSYLMQLIARGWNHMESKTNNQTSDKVRLALIATFQGLAEIFHRMAK
jgi:hypothetical protein